MKVVIDAFGGDNAPREIIKGALEYLKENNDLEIVLCGDEEKVKKELVVLGYKGDKISIVHAPDGVYENYKMISTNPCGEIGMNKDSCRLIAMNLTGYVKNPYTRQAEFDFELFKEHTYKAVKLGDDLVDLELEQVNKILSGLNDDDISEREIWTILRDTAMDVRRMGLGFTGLGDMLAMRSGRGRCSER